MQCNSILIVEDNDDIREAIEDALSSAGYFVFTAPNGQVAQEMLEKIPGPCLVLLDLMMPVMSGWDFVTQSQLKGDAEAQFQVVVITALPAGSVWKTQELSTAAVGYIQKPFDLDQLLEIVSQHCKPTVEHHSSASLPAAALASAVSAPAVPVLEQPQAS